MDNLRFKGARSAARIDNAVGDRIRKRRMLLGYTQEQLADALEISYQQIQKYETGANRVSAGRLFQIAQRLEAPISYFFEGLGLEFDTEVSASATGGSNRVTIEIVRNLGQINDTNIRAAIASLVKALANAPGDGQDSEGASEALDRLFSEASNGSNHGGHGSAHGGSHSNGGSNGKSGGNHGAED